MTAILEAEMVGFQNLPTEYRLQIFISGTKIASKMDK